MNKIVKALKELKSKFPNLIILNKQDKNENSCIVVLGIENCFSEMQLKSISQFSNLYIAVEAYDDDSVGISYTTPSESSKQDGKGLLFIGQSSGEADLDNLSL